MENFDNNNQQLVQQLDNCLFKANISKYPNEFIEYYNGNGSLEDGKEIRSVLEKFLINHFALRVKLKVADNELQILSRLFPECPHERCKFLLRLFSNDTNRLSIVIRILLIYKSDFNSTFPMESETPFLEQNQMENENILSDHTYNVSPVEDLFHFGYDDIKRIQEEIKLTEIRNGLFNGNLEFSDLYNHNKIDNPNEIMHTKLVTSQINSKDLSNRPMPSSTIVRPIEDDLPATLQPCQPIVNSSPVGIQRLGVIRPVDVSELMDVNKHTSQEMLPDSSPLEPFANSLITSRMEGDLPSLPAAPTPSPEFTSLFSNNLSSTSTISKPPLITSNTTINSSIKPVPEENYNYLRKHIKIQTAKLLAGVTTSSSTSSTFLRLPELQSTTSTLSFASTPSFSTANPFRLTGDTNQLKRKVIMNPTLPAKTVKIAEKTAVPTAKAVAPSKSSSSVPSRISVSCAQTSSSSSTTTKNTSRKDTKRRRSCLEPAPDCFIVETNLNNISKESKTITAPPKKGKEKKVVTKSAKNPVIAAPASTPTLSVAQTLVDAAIAVVPSTSSSTSAIVVDDGVSVPATTSEKCKKSGPTCVKLTSYVMEMFPDACPNYIREICKGRNMSEAQVDAVLQIILNDDDYPRRMQRTPTPELDMDLETQMETLKDIFPDADPTYMETHAQMYLKNQEAMRVFISNALETKDYPKLKDYLRRQQLNAQVKQYTTEFNTEKYLEVVPDPVTSFNYKSRKTYKGFFETHLCTQTLKNLYSNLPVKTINKVINNNSNIYFASQELDSIEQNKCNWLKSKRKPTPVDYSTLQNVPLLQEIAFLNNRDQILAAIEEKKRRDSLDRAEAKAKGLMKTCLCCYDEEVMLKDTVECDNGCVACKGCVQRSVEVAFGEGKLEFYCLAGCDVTFNLLTLMNALPPKLFSKVAQKKQSEEVKAAGIEDLECCPFCDFATISPPGDKIFKCLNPDCMKESCRECKEPSHIPLRCDEIEKDEDVKRRIYIENKMTEALVRTCWKCKAKFIKESGCNKMTCSCGAMMCYLCLQPVTDYKHFNGQGGDKYHLCPLYSDTNKLHVDSILKGAESAKRELGVNDKQLVIDPSADIAKHYLNQNK